MLRSTVFKALARRPAAIRCARGVATEKSPLKSTIVDYVVRRPPEAPKRPCTAFSFFVKDQSMRELARQSSGSEVRRASDLCCASSPLIRPLASAGAEAQCHHVCPCCQVAQHVRPREDALHCAGWAGPRAVRACALAPPPPPSCLRCLPWTRVPHSGRIWRRGVGRTPPPPLPSCSFEREMKDYHGPLSEKKARRRRNPEVGSERAERSRTVPRGVRCIDCHASPAFFPGHQALKRPISAFSSYVKANFAEVRASMPEGTPVRGRHSSPPQCSPR